jgi:hypothetical protein
MADTLATKTCTMCKGGLPPLAPQQIPHWELRDGTHRIERKFRFRNFGEALRFVQQVARKHAGSRMDECVAVLGRRRNRQNPSETLTPSRPVDTRSSQKR